MTASERRSRAALLLAAGLLSGCSSQFTDPILEAQAPPPCSTQRVARFDGGAFGSAARLIQDDFTLEAWIKTASSPMGAGFGEGSAIVYADVETQQVDDFAAGTINDKFVFSVGGPDTPIVSTSHVTTNNWVHVAASRTRANGVMLVFVNGVLEGSAVGNDHALADAPTISIAGRTGRNFYTGLLSDLRLWGVVRSQAELTAHMRQRLNGDEPGLLGYYRLDEAAGTTAHDSSPSANDASFTGPMMWVEADSPFCEP